MIDAVTTAMATAPGNPSSAHAGGASARRALELARDDVAALLGTLEPETIYFVSGGTEANNTVISSFALAASASTFLVSPIEHPSMIQPLQSLVPDQVSWLEVDSSGRVDADHARRQASQAAGDVVLLLQVVNSETGVIQPFADIIDAVRSVRPDAYIHLDAAQAIGRIRLDHVTSVDSIALSGHKIHGPQGTGALVVNERSRVRPLIFGGGQENGMRSGTQNVPGIVGLGVAARVRELSFEQANHHMRLVRDRFERSIIERMGEATIVNGAHAARVSNTTNIRFQNIDGMQLLAQLDAAGLMASQGSACSSGRPEPSRVLRAMGLSEAEAFSSLRFSFSILNSPEDAAEAAEIVVATVGRLMR